MAHPVMWFEVLGTDGSKLRTFYGGLFGWGFGANDPIEYGIVNTGDFTALASNFNAAALPGASLGALVPEPAGLGMLGFAFATIYSRKRKRAG